MRYVCSDNFIVDGHTLHHCCRPCNYQLREGVAYIGCASCDSSWPVDNIMPIIKMEMQDQLEKIVEKAKQISKLTEADFFVLQPRRTDTLGFASRAALMHYADVITQSDPNKAQEIRNWVRSLASYNMVNGGRNG